MTCAFVVPVEASLRETCNEPVCRIVDVRLGRDVSARLDDVALALDMLDGVAMAPSVVRSSVVVWPRLDVRAGMLKDTLKPWSLDEVRLPKFAPFKLRTTRSSAVSLVYG